MFVCLGLMAYPQETFTTSAPPNLRQISPHNALHRVVFTKSIAGLRYLINKFTEAINVNE